MRTKQMIVETVYTMAILAAMITIAMPAFAADEVRETPVQVAELPQQAETSTDKADELTASLRAQMKAAGESLKQIDLVRATPAAQVPTGDVAR